ncbi:MAG: hypothetical protein Ct9H300mP1_03490 [Planctomycetaceae bacterium]|nr:MAG: hypothetical protein Ct9H300mP1_03490 [Planctomycetaceae bacterium]
MPTTCTPTSWSASATTSRNGPVPASSTRPPGGHALGFDQLLGSPGSHPPRGGSTRGKGGTYS